MQQFFSSSMIAFLGLVFTSIFWAGNIFVSKILIGIVPPFTLNFLRWLIAIAILAPFTWPYLKGSMPVIKDNWLKLTVYGFLSVCIYNAFLYNAAHSTDALNIAVLSTLTPILTFIFMWWFYGQKPALIQIAGLLLGLFGVLLLLSKGDFENLQQLVFSNGDIWMLVACVSWASYTVFLVKKPAELKPILFLLVTAVFGLILAAPMVAWEIATQHDFNFKLTPKLVISLFYIGLFPSVCSYLFFNNGVAVLGSQTASLCLYMIPIFTAVISLIFLKESVYWFHVVSQILVFSGFYLVLLKRGVNE